MQCCLSYRRFVLWDRIIWIFPPAVCQSRCSLEWECRGGRSFDCHVHAHNPSQTNTTYMASAHKMCAEGTSKSVNADMDQTPNITPRVISQSRTTSIKHR